MNAFVPAETLHRLVKQAIDSGAASSLTEAKNLFRGYRICFSIDAAEGAQLSHQIALLTGIALARRVFLGGVTVAGKLDVPLLVPLARGSTLSEAVRLMGARLADTAPADWPSIFVGGPTRDRRAGFHVRAVFAGWRGGAMPAQTEFSGGEEDVMPLAPMLAAAVCVSEAFFHVQGQTPVAGRRSAGFSLWQPARKDWLTSDRDAPALRYLPSNLWLIGLGHLGQAYLWALGLLPYPNPTRASLILQDTDVITPSTWSTSILTETDMAGIMKTRAMATWAEHRGFGTRIYERLFDASLTRHDEEPAIALCGIDNALGRRVLDRVGFPFVVEAGLGRGYRDFRTIRLHTLPGSRPASEIWQSGAEGEDVSDRAAYQRMLQNGELDQCGITLLAGKAVGAPFVGAVAACFAIAEVLRLLHAGPLHHLIDLDLQSPEHRTVAGHAQTFEALNPGFVPVTAH
ncbi:MAG: thiamine biosynthesis protein ThiF [Alphaproteobacteria bacterium]